MTSRTHTFGGAQPIVVMVSALALIVAAGVVVFLVDGPDQVVAAQDSGVTAAVAAPLEKPDPADAKAIPRVAPDADNIMRGEMIKYRDEHGRLHFRVREPVEGTTANGKTTYWHLDAFLGPQVNSIGAEQKAKGARAKKPKPPRLIMQDGKLVSSGK